MGRCFKSGDEEKLYWALSGQGGGSKKLKPNIVSFIIHDFGHVYPRNKYSYSKEIRQDVKDVCNVTLSGECIRPLLGKLKKTYHEKQNLSAEAKKSIFKNLYEINPPVSASDNIPIQQSDCGCRASTTICDLDTEPTVNKPDSVNNRNVSFNSNGQGSFCFYLGILIFAPFLNKLEKKGLHYIRQWLLAVMLGCQNIEQSKELNYTSLEAITGKSQKTLHSQRLSLKDAATKANTKDFMDAIKMLVRNMFYIAFQPFKEKYNNYRDDHVLFRHLTRSAGTICSTTNGVKVKLYPQMEYQPKTKRIISQVLDEINEMKPEIPDGSRRKIELILKS